MDFTQIITQVGKDFGAYGSVVGFGIFGLYKAGERLLTKYDEINKRALEELKTAHAAHVSTLEKSVNNYREDLGVERDMLKENTRVLRDLVGKIGGANASSVS